jgi:hypothetical protein
MQNSDARAKMPKTRIFDVDAKSQKKTINCLIHD